MTITALSPLDGRYADKVSELSPYFSEYALIKYRLIVEISLFMALSAEKKFIKLPPFSDKELEILSSIIANFDSEKAQKVKKIEQTTNHDVKAIEYFIKDQIKKTSLEKHSEFIHFGCTSEDINNLSYALMISDGLKETYLPRLEDLLKHLRKNSKRWSKIPLLAKTHGQPASPTTIGKEFKIFLERLNRQIRTLNKIPLLGKLNGATGNFNAHLSAYPEIDWLKFSKKFIKKLGLTPNDFTTQIEPHDYMAEVFDAIKRINNIILDLSRDMWLYIGNHIFIQKTVAGEIGSSTMPHKVNPIDFENAEGNLGIANALLEHFSAKLPISRLQRDLSDSTVQRNIGIAFGYSLLAYKSTLKGLDKLELNNKFINEELNNNWEVLAEAIQTMMRKYNIANPYEKLKELTRGKKVNAEIMQKFIKQLSIPANDKKRLSELTPATYTGIATNLVNQNN